MRDTQSTIEWYRSHETAAQLGYNPDGYCLKICREARGIAAMYPSAVSAQNATPMRERVERVDAIQRGMVVYYDDPNDSNPYGHIVTVVGRDKDRNPGDLGSLLVRTNSVVSGKVVVVRGDYFPRYWSDEYKFAATWLNGQQLDLPERPSKTGKKAFVGGNLRKAIQDLQVAIDHHEEKGNTRIVKALRRDINEIRQTLEKFGREEK